MTEKENKLLEHEAIINSGFLDVGDDHEIYWVDWGNKSVKNPIFFLHGGPGGGIDWSDFGKFDPKVHRVVFYDQRGSGRSKPYCSLKNNTTQHLVDDINKLKSHLVLDKISLYGGSWGATLALVYAIQNPGTVEKMLLNAVYLAREEDRQFFIGGGVASHFPEAWQRFRSVAPNLTDAEIAEHYKDVMLGEDLELSKKYAYEWALYEASVIGLTYNLKMTEKSLEKYFIESLAKLEAYYILNGCFIDENYILNNVSKLMGVETVIVHGRQDFVCKPAAAIELTRALEGAGSKPVLHMPAVGHWVRQYPLGLELMNAYTNMLWC